MTRYFVAANIWLIFAAVAVLGRTAEHTDPNMYSFFHKGQWFYFGSYTLIEFALLAVSAGFFILTWKRRKKS